MDPVYSMYVAAPVSGMGHLKSAGFETPQSPLQNCIDELLHHRARPSHKTGRTEAAHAEPADWP